MRPCRIQSMARTTQAMHVARTQEPAGEQGRRNGRVRIGACCAAPTARAGRSSTRRWRTSPRCPTRRSKRSAPRWPAATLVPADGLEVVRSLPHGHVAAVTAQARALGFPRCWARPGPGRVLALLIARVCAPASKLATTHWWADTTLGPDLAVAGATTDEVYAAMDWLAGRQDAIEKTLPAGTSPRQPTRTGWRSSTCPRPGSPGTTAPGGPRLLPRREERPGADRVRAAHRPAGRRRGPGRAREHRGPGRVHGIAGGDQGPRRRRARWSWSATAA